ncbi:MAG TPA: hypothetical protein VNZ48_01575 [Xanthobacteraceae bacterium]|nr:hypothetical protein [Xanthobacteraceae bacterium]
MPAASEYNMTFGDHRQDSYWAVVSDLVSLIERTRTHGQCADEQMEKTEVGARGDRTPPKRATNLAWSDCNQRLREALLILLEARPAVCGGRDRVATYEEVSSAVTAAA